MQSKSRLPNISSFIGRLGNMELMHVDCQGSTGVVSNCSGPSSVPFNRPRQNRSGNSPMARLVQPIVSRGVVWIGG